MEAPLIHSMQQDTPGAGNAWLRLARAPNLFTIPGDILAGFFLAGRGFVSGWAVFPAIFSALCFYLAGLFLNDLVDQEEDAQFRPDRPLVTGEIKPYQVKWASLVLVQAGLLGSLLLGLPVFFLGCCLVGGVLVYTFFSKQIPVIGAFNMGLCRGLSLLLGAFAGSGTTYVPPVAWYAALLIGLYIAAVTALARHETLEPPRPLPVAEVWMAPIVLVLGYTLLLRWYPTEGLILKIGTALCFSAACLLAIVTAYRITDLTTSEDAHALPATREQLAAVLPARIGLLIHTLLFLQAGLLFHARGGWASLTWAVVLLLFWPLSRLTARHYAGS